MDRIESRPGQHGGDARRQAGAGLVQVGEQGASVVPGLTKPLQDHDPVNIQGLLLVAIG
ncbi:hypothetical protein [Micromonospora craniellae]|uniref:hypothetical protein n=1 Tax=Micromonospora craniellae TaxID=2294034 RepID=UPI001313EB4E|nr:hypothetical protein [Micromonospora craniellae]QOC91026.1 hypothetical protein ID554_23700 [Micromonospora craniellae]